MTAPDTEWIIRILTAEIADIDRCLQIRREDVDKLERERADVLRRLSRAVSKRDEEESRD